MRLLFLALLPVAAALLRPTASAADEAKPKAGIKKLPFGKTPDGKAIDLFVLTNEKGMVAKITTYGGILTELHVPDKNGKSGDVVLGFDSLEGYVKGHPFFGANAGRVANRIAKGKFTLDGKEYKLATNNGPNHLHGGDKGFDKKVWEATEIEHPLGPSLTLNYTSPDGEEGYPGTLKVSVNYFIPVDENRLEITFEATTDKPTLVNLAHHSYFNLAGHGSGDVLGHVLKLEADRYTPTDATLIPTGKIEPVKGTPLDFTAPAAIGKHIGELKGEPGGYDHNVVLREGKGVRLAATVTEPTSGRVMKVLTDQPGVQFYTGNFLDGSNKGKGGAVYKKHAGFCLETQKFPDAINHPDFPSVVLRPGQKYKHEAVYAFEVVK